jgi:hypothetical protein
MSGFDSRSVCHRFFKPPGVIRRRECLVKLSGFRIKNSYTFKKARSPTLPIISRFFGVVIYMYWKDHAPAHFHAKYQGEEAVIEIETGKVEGRINARALGMVQEWRQIHRVQLIENWTLAEQKRILRQIKPLE